MKIYKSFNMTSEEDKRAFEESHNGPTYRRILETVDMHLRAELKYGKLRKGEADKLDAVRKLLWEELQDAGLDLYHV